MEETDIHRIRAYVQEVLGPTGSHGLDHIERVSAMCEHIGRIEHANRAVLLPAALLHDIARPREKEESIPHEQEGARMAEVFLTALPYTAGSIPAITHAIRAHRFRSTETPISLEARILSDADKLDAMGAVGIARTFMRAGEHQGTMEDAIRHFHGKLLTLSGLMYTDTAREIAKDRHALLSRYVAALEEEIQVHES